jgi:potassium-transporting ATPase KdpC subunit
MSKIIRPVIVSILVFTVITGILYPLAVTGIAQLFFPVQANGSTILRNDRTVGYSLIGQPFDHPKYFWGRLSATSPFSYNSDSSSGSNMAQTRPDLVKQAQARISALRDADPQASASVPADLATASASGLDPHISPAAAEYQAQRVAKIRGIDKDMVLALIVAYTDQRQFGIFGEPTVNVLKLNLALDELQQKINKERR